MGGAEGGVGARWAPRWHAVAGVAVCLVLGGCAIDRSGLAGAAGGRDGGGTRDARAGDGSMRDAAMDGASDFDAGTDASVAPNFYGVRWEAPTRIAIDRAAPCEMVFDPVLTPDLSWLLLSHFDTDDCEIRRFQVYAWNDGAPAWMYTLGPIHPAGTEHNGHVIPGSAAGRPADRLLLYTTEDSSAGRELMAVWLSGEPPVTSGSPITLGDFNTDVDDSGPTATADGRVVLFDRDGDLWEATGSGPLAWGTPTKANVLSTDEGELDPATTPDGRVVVFARYDGSDWDLWVAERAALDAPWESPTRLPAGSGQINTADDEWDAFIASNGDLLFTRRRDGVQEGWLAQAVF